MLIIGELINATRKEVREAIIKKDQGFLQGLARAQDEAGAHYIDINVALDSAEKEQEMEDMQWAVEAIRVVCSKPLALDTTSYNVLEAGLKLHGPGAMVNSINAEEGRLVPFISLAREYDALAVALPLGAAGIPKDAASRYDIAERILETAQKEAYNIDKLYFDPLGLPLAVDDQNALITLETLQLFKKELGVKTTLGLTNISYSSPARSLLNRNFLVLAMGLGLDSALVNPLDRALMSAIYAVEALLGRDPYCSAYIRQFRRGNLVV